MRSERNSQLPADAELARAVAAEDLGTGDYIYVLNELLEMVPCGLDGESWKATETRKFMCLPFSDMEPMKVVEVCLPVLLVKDKAGKHSTLDARLYRFARLPDRFGRKVFKRLRRSMESSAGLAGGASTS